MTNDMTGKKVMLLVANGFAQMDFISIQRELGTCGADVTVVSSEKNLVNGFNGSEWGLTFPVDQQIDSVLGSDFDAVVIVGGEQSVKRLDATPHSSRILEAFAETSKPVVLVNEAVSFDIDGGRHIMKIEGEVSEDVIEDIKSFIVPTDGLAKAA